MSIVVPDKHFNSSGELSDTGKDIFWSEISKALQKFDLGEITLQPRNYQNNNAPPAKFIKNLVHEFNDDKQQKLKKLPTPPKSEWRECKRSHSRRRNHSSSRSRRNHRCYSESPKRKHMKNSRSRTSSPPSKRHNSRDRRDHRNNRDCKPDRSRHNNRHKHHCHDHKYY